MMSSLNHVHKTRATKSFFAIPVLSETFPVDQREHSHAAMNRYSYGLITLLRWLEGVLFEMNNGVVGNTLARRIMVNFHLLGYDR